MFCSWLSGLEGHGSSGRNERSITNLCQEAELRPLRAKSPTTKPCLLRGEDSAPVGDSAGCALCCARGMLPDHSQSTEVQGNQCEGQAW